MTENEGTKQPPPPNVWPTFRARDTRGLIQFLVDALGFEAVVVYGEGDKVDHAELAWPAGGGVMLGSVRDQEQWAVAHGAKVTHELYDTDYGSRDFAIEDPEGNRWSFGTYPGHPR